MSRPNDDTPILCLACGGNYEFTWASLDEVAHTSRCPWCTVGNMSLEQIAKWHAFLRSVRQQP